MNPPKITVLGGQLAILCLAKNSSNTFPSQQPDSSSTNQTPQGYKNPSASASVKLTTVTFNMTLPQFWKFRVDGSVYTTVTGLPTKDCTAYLYSACDPTVQYGPITSKPEFLNFVEIGAIDTIKSLATKHSNPMVNRITFHTIKQDDTESIQDFLIRL